MREKRKEGRRVGEEGEGGGEGRGRKKSDT
jgi:hypothetical protein